MTLRASILPLCLASHLGACWSTEATPLRCDKTCIADPWPHCITEGTCTDDADCAGGLSCSAPEKQTTCRWEPPTTQRDALKRGFQAQTMDLAVKPPPDFRLEWTNPEDARFVACAVFTCNPVVRKRANDSGNPSDEAPTGETTLWRIANAEACMFELHVADAPQVSQRIDGTPWDPHEHDLQASPMCVSESSSDRVINFFAAGCWAYDFNQVIAASELVPIAAADIASVVPVSTTCVQDADLCYDAAHQFYGSCLNALCAPRCTDDANCAEVVANLFHEPQTTAEGWRCDKMIIPNSPVGVCVPPTSP